MAAKKSKNDSTSEKQGTISEAKTKLSDWRQKRQAKRADVVTGTGQVASANASVFVRWGFWVLIALAVLGGFAGCSSAMLSQRPAPAVEKSGIDQQAQNAGSYASGFVGAWLDATGSEHEVLDSYFTSSGASFPNEATEYKDLAVAETSPGPHQTTTVTVAAATKTSVENNGKTETRWVPRRYEVTVAEKDGKYTPLGYPAPVSAPGTSEVPQTEYTHRSTSPELADSVEDFLAAYATGKGDVSRYISPDADISAISPAPYDKAKVASLKTKEEVDDGQPKDGQTAEAQVSVTYSSGDSSRTADYILKLTGRGGRWEISSIDSAPALKTK